MTQDTSSNIINHFFALNNENNKGNHYFGEFAENNANNDLAQNKNDLGNEADNELKFVTEGNDYVDNSYARIDKVGDTTGYYYLYQKNGSEYKVYRMNIQDKGNLTYLFSTKSINNISICSP